MKKLLATILCCAMLVSVTACSSGSGNSTEPTQPSATASTEATQSTEPATMNNDEIKAHIDSVLKKNKFEGIVYLTKNGSVVYQSTTGKDEKGNDLTVGSGMYVGSTSKQFCATAIMMLKEQGKLSVDDTLDKYFPEFQYGKDITIKNLLTMRSGIINYFALDDAGFSQLDEINTENLLTLYFSQPLTCEPDTAYEYSNTNYFILACIVEQVSGKDYQTFIRENIFEPLEMSDTGFVSEVKNEPEWSTGLDYNKIEEYLDTAEANDISADDFVLILNGAGDIVSNAYDMDKWMTGLVSGKLISRESYEEMIVDYSPDDSTHYGYGLMKNWKGVCHGGYIFTYTTQTYIKEELGYNMFITNNVECNVDNLMLPILKPLVY